MNVLGKLHAIKESFEAKIEPLTQQYILSTIKPPSKKHKHSADIASSPSPIKYHPSQQTIQKLKEVQSHGLTRTKQFQFVFGKVFMEHCKDNSYILTLGELENSINQTLRTLTNSYLKPITEEVIAEYEQEEVEPIINKVKQFRGRLGALKAVLITKNENIRKLLVKKQNIERYLQEVREVQDRITPIYRTLDSEQEIKIISDHVKDCHSKLKGYNFYNTLSSFLNNRIYEFERNLRKVIVQNLRKIEVEEMKEMAVFLATLSLFKKENLPDLMIYCFKKALEEEIESFLKQYSPQNTQVIRNLLSSIEHSICSKCFCQFLLLCQNLLTNFELLGQIFQSTTELTQPHRVIKEKLMMFYEEFRNVLCRPLTNQIFLFSVIHHFCTIIIGDEDAWCIIARSAAQHIKSNLIQCKNAISEDLNLQLWNAVDFQTTTKLPVYQQILTLQLDYHQQIEWILSQHLKSRLDSSPMPDCHILYSFYKFSKTFERSCLNIPYFCPLDANFLISSVLELLSCFIVEVVRTLIDYPPLNLCLYQKRRHWSNFKNTFDFLKHRQSKKELKPIPDQQKLQLLCDSLRFINQLVRGHEWVLMYKHGELSEPSIERLRELENVLEELPTMAYRCFIKSRLRQINLEILEKGQLISQDQPDYGRLAESFDLGFLRTKQSKLEFSRQFQYLLIDKICSQNPKVAQFNRMIQQFSIMRRLLQNRGYYSGKEVQIFLATCLSRQEDEILKLLYEKKLVYSLKTIEFLCGLLQAKQEDRLEFWQVLSSLCGGEPTEF